jgi:hypothetical protein
MNLRNIKTNGIELQFFKRALENYALSEKLFYSLNFGY